MLVDNVMRTYHATPVKPSHKSDLMVISEMKSLKIIRFLAYRHRVGLLMLGVLVSLAYILWDKLVQFLV